MADNKNKYLTGEQIAAFAEKLSIVRDSPELEKVPCGYCGALTKQHGYTVAASGFHYPPCCFNCLDMWMPDNQGVVK